MPSLPDQLPRHKYNSSISVRLPFNLFAKTTAIESIINNTVTNSISVKYIMRNFMRYCESSSNFSMLIINSNSAITVLIAFYLARNIVCHRRKDNFDLEITSDSFDIYRERCHMSANNFNRSEMRPIHYC